MNSKTSIHLSLNTYEDFETMIKERHRLGYEKHIRLEEFVVLGSYYLDTCGNCMKSDPRCRPLTLIPHIPNVLTKDEFNELIKTLPKDQRRFSWSFSSGLPPGNNVCSHCGKKWTLKTCYDLRIEHNTIDYPLNNFVGKPLSKVKKYLKSITDKSWIANQPELMIRNDKYIDLSPKPGYEQLKMNEHGWLGKDEGITDAHIIEKGDETYINEWKYFHPECMKKVIKTRLIEKMEDSKKLYTYLPNLAGNEEADLYVEAELTEAKIHKVKHIPEGEVPTNFAGELGNFKFWRAWHYWVVNGPVPMDIAIKMYEDPEGSKSVRVAGHCGCPHPKEWDHAGFIDTYHIDTLQGLQLFVNSIKSII
jgi:hypothetical protein